MQKTAENWVLFEGTSRFLAFLTQKTFLYLFLNDIMLKGLKNWII